MVSVVFIRNTTCGIGNIEIYLNGTLDTARTLVGSSATSNAETEGASQFTRIGPVSGGVPGNINATVDELMIIRTNLNAGNISALYKTLAKQLRLSGFSPTNRIDPHITIGRLAKRKDRQLQTEILDTISTSGTTYVSSPETGIVKVEKLYIYESISMPTQTKYRIIRSFNLSG